MRVSKVTFSQPIKLNGRFVSEFVGDDIEFDKESQTIRIGRKNIPIGKVNEFDEAERGYPCHFVDPATSVRCQYAASDPRGLGAHQRHKHGVAGLSPGRDGFKERAL